MMKSKVTRTVMVVLVMSMAFALLTATAWAGPATITQHAKLVVGTRTTDLYGMDDAAALTAISRETSVPVTKIVLTGNGKSYVPFLIPGSCWVDRYATLVLAKGSVIGTDTFTFKPVVKVDAARVAAWVSAFNRVAYSAPVNSYIKISNGKLTIPAAKNGYTCNSWITKKNITARLVETKQLGKSNAGTVYCTMVPIKPTRFASYYAKTKTIIVVLSKRQLWLYTGAKITVTYKVAIGQPSYPTPPGIWHVYRRVVNPTWYNPGSAWARNMPSSMSGASSPLGLRALYLANKNGVDFGIRIHGTKNIGSIGTPASHGCIRVANSNIVKLYPLVPMNTLVYIVR